MRIRRVFLAATATATVGLLTACGVNTEQARADAPISSSSTPSSTSITPSPTSTTTTKPAPAPAPKTTTTTKLTPKPKQEARPAAVGAPCSAAARACIDLSANRAWLLENGKVVYGPTPITHGRAGWLTPAGTFRVYMKNRHHRSREFDNAPMPYSVFFNGGIAFHQGSLREKSHGCIHLSHAAARTFFNTLRIGDIVQVVP
jgi:lipoprotein-anchoring transpeptidase ErfK/SrfK